MGVVSSHRGFWSVFDSMHDDHSDSLTHSCHRALPTSTAKMQQNQ